jgi:hypothetical protein
MQNLGIEDTFIQRLSRTTFVLAVIGASLAGASICFVLVATAAAILDASGATPAAIAIVAMLCGAILPVILLKRARKTLLAPETAFDQSGRTEPSFAHIDQPDPAENATDDRKWFYVENGLKKGPVSTSQLHQIADRVGPNFEVWTEGYNDWQPYKRAPASGHSSPTPPPLSPQMIDNTWVWLVALTPLIVAIVDAVIVQIRLENLAATGWWNVLEFRDVGGAMTVGRKRLGGLPWQTTFILSSLFVILDLRKLRQAGHPPMKTDILWGFLLVPVYLFVRAKRLRQKPNYAVTWIICAAISIFVD